MIRKYLDPVAPAGGTPPANPPATPPAAAVPPAAATPSAAAPALTPEQLATLTPNPASPQAAAPVVPDKYDIKLPDGSPLEPASVQKVEAYAKEHKLTNEQAQELLRRDSDAVASYITEGQNKLKANAGKFVEELKADPEIGGEGFTKNVELAKRVMEKFATPKLKQILNDTGLGNHPELVRVFAKIGLNMAEDKLVQGAAPPQASSESKADKLYNKK